MFQSDWSNLGLANVIRKQRMILAPNQFTGLILHKKNYAELVSHGSAVGGRFDDNVLNVYQIGGARVVVPSSSEEWQRSIKHRQDDIKQMMEFYEEHDLSLRAVSMLRLLHQCYGSEALLDIPTDLLALLTGTNATVVQLATEQILNREIPAESSLLPSVNDKSKVVSPPNANSITDPDTIKTSQEAIPFVTTFPKSLSKKAIGGLLLTGAGLTTGALSYFRGDLTSAVVSTNSSMEKPDEQILLVSTHRITPSSGYSVERTYAGEVQAKRTSNLGFEIAGSLISFPYQEGDRIQAGEILARLDTRSLLAQRRQLLAQRDQAEAQLAELKNGPRTEEIEVARASVQEIQLQIQESSQRSQRGKQLYEKGAISRESYEERYFSDQVLQKRLRQAKIRLEELEIGTRVERLHSQIARIAEINASLNTLNIEVSKATLQAPFSGYIAKKSVSEGVALNAGQSVLELVETEALDARVGIPKDVADRLKPGQTWPLKVGSETYPATIRSFLPNVDDQSRTVTVALKFEPKSFIQLGQSVTLTLKSQTALPGFWLPTTALVPGARGLWSTYVLKPAPESEVNSGAEPIFAVTRRDVEILHTQGEKVYVRGMLTADDQIIDRGSHRLATGQRVRVSDPSKK